jgi:hypothetical protein
LDIVVSTKTKTVPILVFPVLFGKYNDYSRKARISGGAIVREVVPAGRAVKAGFRTFEGRQFGKARKISEMFFRICGDGVPCARAVGRPA